MPTENEKPKLTGIAFIRPRIVHPDGWYYREDKTAAEIANNAIDDIEVCLERIDEIEPLAGRFEALRDHTGLDFCDYCWIAGEYEPMEKNLLWQCKDADTGKDIQLCDGCYNTSQEEE